MVDILEMAAQSPWTHERSGSSILVLKVKSGESLPAASGYDAGDRLYDGNTGRMLMAETHGATTRWLTRPTPIKLTEDNGAYTGNKTLNLPYCPLSYETALLTKIRGHWDQTSATTGTNYYTFTLTFLGVSLWSLSTQNLANDEWVLENTAANAVLDYNSGGTDLTGNSDTTGANGLRLAAAEAGTQTLFSQMVAWVQEIGA